MISSCVAMDGHSGPLLIQSVRTGNGLGFKLWFAAVTGHASDRDMHQSHGAVLS